MRRRLGVATVHGRSMEPTLHEGDRVVVLYGARPRPGRMAVVRLPDGDAGPRPLAVKRVTGRAPGQPAHWWVERDSPSEGIDSWQVGPIARADVLAVVLVRLPAPLAARLARLRRSLRRR